MSKTKEYRLIPMAEITDEAKKIAVAWCDGFESDLGVQIHQRHKLASDIMNYADQQSAELSEKVFSLKNQIAYLSEECQERENRNATMQSLLASRDQLLDRMAEALKIVQQYGGLNVDQLLQEYESLKTNP